MVGIAVKIYWPMVSDSRISSVDTLQPIRQRIQARNVLNYITPLNPERKIKAYVANK